MSEKIVQWPSVRIVAVLHFKRLHIVEFTESKVEPFESFDQVGSLAIAVVEKVVRVTNCTTRAAETDVEDRTDTSPPARERT